MTSKDLTLFEAFCNNSSDLSENLKMFVDTTKELLNSDKPSVKAQMVTLISKLEATHIGKEFKYKKLQMESERSDNMYNLDDELLDSENKEEFTTSDEDDIF